MRLSRFDSDSLFAYAGHSTREDAHNSRLPVVEVGKCLSCKVFIQVNADWSFV